MERQLDGQTDRQTDVTKLVVAFCIYVNGPAIEAAAGTGSYQQVLGGCTVCRVWPCGVFGRVVCLAVLCVWPCGVFGRVVCLAMWFHMTRMK